MTKAFSDHIGGFTTLLFVILIFCGKLNLLSAQNDYTEGWVYGINLSYNCLGQGEAPGNNTYEITAKHYRTCGAVFPDHHSYLIYKDQEPLLLSTLMTLDTVVEHHNPDYSCYELSDSICLNVGYYSSFGELPISDTSYYAVFFKCCRGDTLVNIPPSPVGELPIGFGSFIEITPSAQQQCNNSPVFHELLPTVICKDDLLQATLVADEADGDQLIYEFNNPFNWAVGYDTVSMMPVVNIFSISPPPYPPIPFRTPEYDYLHPFGWSSHHFLDPNTGELEIIPNQTGDYTIGFKVSEYRDGQLLSTAFQDLVIKVVECTPTVEALIVADNIDDEGVFVTNICNTNELLIDNQSTQLAYIEDYVWQFTFNDNIWMDTSWSPALSFLEGGTLQAQLLLEGEDECRDTANMIVNVTPELYSDFSFIYDTCIAEPISFNNLSFTSDGIIQSLWDFGDGETSTFFQPVHQYITPGNYTIKLIIENDLGCRDSTVKQLSWYPIPANIKIVPSEPAGCFPLLVDFDNLSRPIDSTYDVNWEMGDGSFNHTLSPSHIYDEEGLYSLSVGIISPLGCYLDTTLIDFISVSSPPIANFDWTPLEATSLNSTVGFRNQSERNFSNFWTVDGILQSLEEHFTYTFTEERIHEVELLVSDQYGCVDTVRNLIDYKYEFTYFLPNSFTPNGDGKNDIYRGVGVFTGITDFEMIIWNRNGEKVFTTDNIHDGWDGYDQQSGRPLAQGVYLCTVRFQFADDKWERLKGNVLLIR